MGRALTLVLRQFIQQQASLCGQAESAINIAVLKAAWARFKNVQISDWVRCSSGERPRRIPSTPSLVLRIRASACGRVPAGPAEVPGVSSPIGDADDPTPSAKLACCVIDLFSVSASDALSDVFGPNPEAACETEAERLLLFSLFALFACSAVLFAAGLDFRTRLTLAVAAG